MKEKSESIPKELECVPVTILSNSDDRYPGSLVLMRWSDGERRSRAFRRTSRIVGTVFACSLIGLFVHILLLVIIPALVLTLLFAFPLFQKFLAEDATFVRVDGKCPYCNNEEKLIPYLDTQFKKQVTVQCPDCGQTIQVVVP